MLGLTYEIIVTRNRNMSDIFYRFFSRSIIYTSEKNTITVKKKKLKLKIMIKIKKFNTRRPSLLNYL